MERPFLAYTGDEPYIFVCYSHEDAALVYPEIERLHEEGFNIWYDEGVEPGSFWRDEVALSLTQCAVFLLFLTPSSNASENCKQELNFALSRERKILPVNLLRTELSMTFEFSLSTRQFIVREDYTETVYQQKLTQALLLLLPDQIKAKMARSREETTSIGILPLVNLSNSPDHEYLSDGISEELVHTLSQFDGLRVVSAFSFKGRDVDIKVVGDALNVDTLLEGSLQVSGERVRITTRLNLVQDGSTLWSHRFDETLSDIFELQDSVVRKVVDALKIELKSSQRSMLYVGTQDIDAYNAYLLGIHLKRRDTQEGYEEAITYFQRACSLDPGYGVAHYQLGECCWKLTPFKGVDPTLVAKAEAALTESRLQDYLPEIPWVEVQRRIHPEERPGQRELAIEAHSVFLNPDPQWRFFEYVQMARCLGGAGYFQAALEYLSEYLHKANHAVSDREDIEYDVRMLLSSIGQFDKAIDAWSELLNTQPDNLAGRMVRAQLYSRTGQVDKAEYDLAKISKVAPLNFSQFYHLFWQQDLSAAESYFESLEEKQDLLLRYKFFGCLLLGQFDKGVNYIEQSLARGAPMFNIRLLLRSTLPRSLVNKVEQHQKYKDLLAKSSINEAWVTELLALTNELTKVSGILARFDEDY